jgi:RNA polymerase sigma-70 factor, ECF subfamily
VQASSGSGLTVTVRSLARRRKRYARPVMSEAALVAGLRAGDESAFRMLIEMYHAALVRVARMYVSTQAVAEEVAQETWLAVVEGIDRFEGRSSLKTWIFRILTNRAKTRGVREGRSLPFSSLESDSPAVETDRFRGAGENWPGHWAAPPIGFPEERLLAGEAREVIERAIAALPPTQRTVISLRDVEGWSSEEVCNALTLSETNQRVLLHRARSAVRAALERYLEESST